MPTSFLALYRGESVGSAQLVAVSADPDLVREFADRLLASDRDGPGDPVTDAVDEGRREALKLVRDEAQEGGD